MDRIVILAAPRKQTDAATAAWNDAAIRLAAEPAGKHRIELALAHSSTIIDDPQIVIDAGGPVHIDG